MESPRTLLRSASGREPDPTAEVLDGRTSRLAPESAPLAPRVGQRTSSIGREWAMEAAQEALASRCYVD